MSRVRELFGIYCSDNADFSAAISTQLCPYSGKKCYKTRKSEPGTVIGTCTVHYQNQNIIICPNRLTEKQQIFLDCLHLLTLHEPGNELYLIPELSIPGGHVDYFLVSVNQHRVKDFVGIELQTMDTTGTIWPERQRLLAKHHFPVDTADINSTRSFGMNWKMTAKTILVQMHHKAQTFERINKHLVLILQNPLYHYMRTTFSFEHIHGCHLSDTVHFHSYSCTEDDGRLHLSLDTRESTNAEGIAKCLGLHVEADMTQETLISMLEGKLSEEYRFSLCI